MRLSRFHTDIDPRILYDAMQKYIENKFNTTKKRDFFHRNLNELYPHSSDPLAELCIKYPPHQVCKIIAALSPIKSINDNRQHSVILVQEYLHEYLKNNPPVFNHDTSLYSPCINPFTGCYEGIKEIIIYFRVLDEKFKNIAELKHPIIFNLFPQSSSTEKTTIVFDPQTQKWHILNANQQIIGTFTEKSISTMVMKLCSLMNDFRYDVYFILQTVTECHADDKNKVVELMQEVKKEAAWQKIHAVTQEKIESKYVQTDWEIAANTCSDTAIVQSLQKFNKPVSTATKQGLKGGAFLVPFFAVLATIAIMAFVSNPIGLLSLAIFAGAIGVGFVVGFTINAAISYVNYLRNQDYIKKAISTANQNSERVEQSAEPRIEAVDLSTQIIIENTRVTADEPEHQVLTAHSHETAPIGQMKQSSSESKTKNNRSCTAWFFSTSPLKKNEINKSHHTGSHPPITSKPATLAS